MKILVPIKRVADPDNAQKAKVSADGKRVTAEGLEWRANPFDEYALEAALRLIENGKTQERVGEIVAVALGPKEAQQTLRSALAMGADRAILVAAEDDVLDSDLVARALAKVVEQEKPDLVLMGKQAVDGESNQVGQILAELTKRPMATFAMAIERDTEGKVLSVGREVDGGVLKLRVKLPAVVTVDLRIVASKAVRNPATPQDFAYADGPRYAALKGIMAAKKKPLAETTLAGLGVDPAPKLRYVKFEPPPPRKAGVKVETVPQLVDKLHTEAKVI